MRWIANLDGGPRRVNHASVAVGDYIYSFGGYCTGEDYRSTCAIDVHILNTNNMRWSLAPTMKDEYGVMCKYPDVPFQRYGHTAIAYEHKVYIWGGRNDEIVCDILFCFDTKTLKWSKPLATGKVPGARDGHSACLYGNRMYIFGGFEEMIDKFSCDVHYLDLETMHWTFVDTRGDPPSYRDFHSATIVNHKMFVFGGRGDSWGPYHSQEEIYCPKIVCLDLRTNRWEMPNTTGEEPLGRRSHSACKLGYHHLRHILNTNIKFLLILQLYLKTKSTSLVATMAIWTYISTISTVSTRRYTCGSWHTPEDSRRGHGGGSPVWL